MKLFLHVFDSKNALLSGANSPNLNSLERFRHTMPPTVVRNHHFQSFCDHQRVKFVQRGPKAINSEHSPKNVHTKVELDCVDTFPENGRKPPFSVILWPLEGQNLGNMAKSKSFLNTHPISVHTKFGMDCVNTFPDNGPKPPISVILWPLGGQNLGNMAKSKSFLNTHPISVHTKFGMDCVNTFPDNGPKPPISVILWPLGGQNLANVAKKQITERRSPFLCSLRTSSARTKMYWTPVKMLLLVDVDEYSFTNAMMAATSPVISLKLD